MKVILLPGLDGTGLLFERLIKSLPRTLDIEVISYDSVESLQYSDQAVEISKRFYGEDIFIVGESYSGRVAYELCRRLGQRVRGIVFLASFISRPSIMSGLANYFPVSLITSNIFSKKLLYILGFGLTGESKLVSPVFASIKKADKRKLKTRLCNIASLSKPLQMINCPVTYIRPSRDFLVGVSAVEFLASKCSSFTQIEVNGGHFIAQSNPVECAKIIYDAVHM